MSADTPSTFDTLRRANSRARGNASIPESEDTIRNLKASESVQSAFQAAGFPSPPGDIAAIMTNHVKSAVQEVPISKVANMASGSGELGAAALRAVDSFVNSLTPAQREAVRAGVNPLDATAMMKLNAMLNPDAGNFGKLGGGGKEAVSESSARFNGLNGPVNLTPLEKSTRDYAIREGVMWAADNREILKLGTGAIDIIKQTQLRKDVYDGLTKDAHLSSPGALGIAKAIHDKGGDANASGQEVTKNLKEVGDSEYTAAVDRFGKTHFKKDATQAEKDAASEDVRNAGESAAHRRPEHADKIKRNNELIGAVKKDELATKATADKNATADAKRAQADKAVAAKQATKSKLLATLD